MAATPRLFFDFQKPETNFAAQPQDFWGSFTVRRSRYRTGQRQSRVETG
jgi:hypothetical protein